MVAFLGVDRSVTTVRRGKDQETAVPGVSRRRGFSTISDIRLS